MKQGDCGGLLRLLCVKMSGHVVLGEVTALHLHNTQIESLVEVIWQLGVSRHTINRTAVQHSCCHMFRPYYHLIYFILHAILLPKRQITSK